MRLHVNVDHVATLRNARGTTYPDPIEASRLLGVEQIELHTGEYAHAFATPKAEHELARLAAAAKHGREMGLEIAAGHGLTTKNVPALMKLPEVIELNIGHALVADAV